MTPITRPWLVRSIAGVIMGLVPEGARPWVTGRGPGEGTDVSEAPKGRDPSRRHPYPPSMCSLS